MPRISENFVENSEPHQRFERAFYRRENCKDEWMQNCVKVSVIVSHILKCISTSIG
jgi:hypothetical protein